MKPQSVLYLKENSLVPRTMDTLSTLRFSSAFAIFTQLFWTEANNYVTSLFDFLSSFA